MSRNQANIVNDDYQEIYGDVNILNGDYCKIYGKVNVCNGDYNNISGDVNVLNGDYCIVGGKININNSSTGSNRSSNYSAGNVITIGNSSTGSNRSSNYSAGNVITIGNSSTGSNPSRKYSLGNSIVDGEAVYHITNSSSFNLGSLNGITVVNGEILHPIVSSNVPTTTIPDLSPNEAESDQTPQCVICLCRQAVTVTVPCGHRIYCISCCHQLKSTVGLNKPIECSTCRQSLTSIIRLF